MITPENLPEWEKEWIKTEETQLGRPKAGEPIKHCTDCLPEIECSKVWFIDDIRLVNFPQFQSRTFVMGSIEECPFLKKT